MSPTRVLIIDDSPTMRLLIGRALREAGDIEIVGEAGDAFEARKQIKMLDPDVVTLDVEMPGMRGIDFLEKIMRLRPMPVVMVSSQTGPGTSAAIEALAIGAFDCFAKPRRANDDAFNALAGTVRLAAQSRHRLAAVSARRNDALAAPPKRTGAASAGTAHAPGRRRPAAIGIGASTGGIEALTALFADWPPDCPPTFVVQHLPAGFTRGFAQRLARSSPVRVVEAEDGMPIETGTVYLAPGGIRHLMVVGASPVCSLVEAAPVSGHRPSVDVLLHSLARRFGKSTLGIVLTGMGSDGAHGALEIRKSGGWTIGQNEQSSLVYGMPKAAFNLGAIDEQLALESISNAAFGA
ncbi:protein-glutamate methylesterase/protein-glutamine glutaminase [Aureimonas pseudogalii]|uniref:Protein-glutamate methylesterase/protein-glutamine glutaminase n=1 Tax=Aureimonas pseudogalii TaxID=1744844 RepID=A0A7W6H6T1_9HYPH|nr:chemotaxis response regulator protein-glutamate methylesterase [Aureimonas pseudogalii]MBB3999637.1 two-component system chemotaxis response regulator CheB [Aureimonas pseudogalii]